MKEKTPGQVAYETWGWIVGSGIAEEHGVGHPGVPLFPYSMLSERSRSGWEAAAKAVRNLPAPHGTISAREERWCDYCGGEGELYISAIRKYEKCACCEGKGKVEAK